MSDDTRIVSSGLAMGALRLRAWAMGETALASSGADVASLAVACTLSLDLLLPP